MKQRLAYVELKSGYGDSGPAWIGFVKPSKSGRTVYFNGLALKAIKRGGIAGNHFDILTGEEYWVSGIKRSTQDRHWAGGGPVSIDRSAVEPYLKAIERSTLPKHLDVVDLGPSVQTDEHKACEDGTAHMQKPNLGRYAYSLWLQQSHLDLTEP